MEFLKELGFQFNEEALRRDYKGMKLVLTEKQLDFYKLIAQFVAITYDEGRNGKPVSDLFPFLKDMEGVKEHD